jgi:CBS domain-containing protein
MKLTIGEVMSRAVDTISADAMVEQAAKHMRTLDIGFLPVLEDERPVGVITDRDILTRVVAEGLRPELTRVSEIMTPTTIACYEDEEITVALLLMETNLVHRLLVLDRRERLVGIVSLGDLAARGGKESLAGHVLGRILAA